MGHILGNFGEYEKRGAGVVGILAQDPEKVKQYLKNHSYPFPLLVDEDRTVVKDFGVHVKVNFESVNIARPSNFILDIEGTIRFMFIGSNQRDFPEDDQIYSVLAGLSKPAEG